MTDIPKTRIPPLPREEWTDASRDVCAFWGEPNAWEEGSKTNIINTMATHPPLGSVYNQWGIYFLMKNTLATRHLELIVMRVAWRVKSIYEWHNHVGYSLNAGITLDEIAKIKEDLSAHNWAEQDKAVMQAVDDLIDNNVISDALWATLTKYYSKQQMMDLTFTIGHYVMTSWALSSFGVQLESPDPIGFDLKHKSGKTPGISYKPGETENWTETRGY